MHQAERLRVETLSLTRRAHVLREYIHIYELLLVCLIRLLRPQPALEVAERGRSPTLSDLLTLRTLRREGAGKPCAIRAAQRWLREVTSEEVGLAKY